MKPSIQDFFLRGKEISVLYQQILNRTSVHAFLITGERGIGKKTLARLMAAALLCESEGGKPCGLCRSCLMSEKDEHPDIVLIRKGIPLSPDVKKDRMSIPVDDIREMIRICGQKPLMGRGRVVMITEAEKMTAQAQNSLLKTLEEPPDQTIFFLVTESPETLLPTVRSRCRLIRMKPWPDDYIEHILKENLPIGQQNHIQEVLSLANGSIGGALELAGDEEYWKKREETLKAFFNTTQRSEILRISSQYRERKAEGETILEILESYLQMLIRSRYVPDKKALLAAFPQQWKTFAEKAPEERICALTDKIVNARKQMMSNVNFQAIIERLLFDFMGEGNQWSM